MQYYLTDEPRGPAGFLYVSTASEWSSWVTSAVPAELDTYNRRILVSNLKHILCGLEMKAGLLESHYCLPNSGNPNCLFEPYAAILTFEFCVGVFSVAEGLGAALSMASGNLKPHRAQWTQILHDRFGQMDSEFESALKSVQSVRDLIHQDRAGQRRNIDWHEFGLASALLPAAKVLSAVFDAKPNHLPSKSNLITFDRALISSVKDGI